MKAYRKPKSYDIPYLTRRYRRMGFTDEQATAWAKMVAGAHKAKAAPKRAPRRRR